MARRTTSLRAVPANKPSTKRAPAKKSAGTATVAQAAKTGDRRAFKVALRDRLAAAIDQPNCPARELSVLLKQLNDLYDEIAEIDDAANVDEPGDTEIDDDVDDSFDTSVI